MVQSLPEKGRRDRKNRKISTSQVENLLSRLSPGPRVTRNLEASLLEALKPDDAVTVYACGETSPKL